MLIGTLSLTGAGIPHALGFAGFYSKDAIIEAAYAGHTPNNYAYWLLVVAAFMTAFYAWRLMFLTFHGSTRADRETYEHAHESPWVMLVPLIILALGAVAAVLPSSSSLLATTPKPSGAPRCSRARTTTSCTLCTRCPSG